MACSKKIMIFLIRTYGSACEHPFVLGMLFFLLMLYIFLPSVFGFLVSSSPTIICTFLLLGTLLTFGQQSIHELEEEEKMTDEPSLLQVGSAANDLVVKRDKRLSMVSHTENRGNVTGIPLTKAKFTEQGDRACKVESNVLLSASNEAEERKDEAVVGTCSSLEWRKNQIHFEKQAIDKREVNGRALFEKAQSHEECLIRDARQVATLATSGEKRTQNLKVDMHVPMMERDFYSSLDPSQKFVSTHDASNSSSRHTERRPHDASSTDITPMVDKVHPIIDSGAPQPVNTSVDDPHSVSGSYLEDCNYAGNVEENTEHLKEGTQKEKNDESTIPATCTTDDEMNHMDLSSSILVRTKRLKSLIIKRRARKNMRAEAEKSLRGLNINKTAAMMDKRPHIQLRIPPISRERQNPLDLPLSSEDELDLPGSAPSAFLPRGNLFDEFDLPFDQEDENGGLADVSLGHQCPTSLPQKDTFFRRYESFTIGASATGEGRQEKHDMKLMPDFEIGSPILEEPSCVDFQRQTDGNFSKIASVPAPESSSSVEGREYNEPLEQELHQDSYSKLIFPCDVKHVRKKSVSDDEVDFAESPGREEEINICGIHKVDDGTLKVFEEGPHETFDDFVEYEKKVRYEMDLHSATSDAANTSDLAKVRYMESSSSRSLEVGENISTKIEERSSDLQQSAGDDLKGFDYSIHSPNREDETSNDIHVVQLANNNSSPSVTGKPSLSIASFDSNSFLSTASETEREASDSCSPKAEEMTNALEVGDLASGKGNRGGKTRMSDNGALFVLPSNLSSVENNESRSGKADENILGTCM